LENPIQQRPQSKQGKWKITNWSFANRFKPGESLNVSNVLASAERGRHITLADAEPINQDEQPTEIWIVEDNYQPVVPAQCAADTS
jgi:hypothetical protein